MMASGKMALAVMNDRVVTIEDLARRHRVSKNHLMKVAQTLVRLGLVRSMRGRAGGLMLARDPAEIRMGAVVRALEEEMQLVSCLGEGPATCVLIGPVTAKVCEMAIWASVPQMFDLQLPPHPAEVVGGHGIAPVLCMA